MGRQWQEIALTDSAWRPPPGLSRADRAAEQDRAAGGRDKRIIASNPRQVLASIYFRRTAGRRIYAYLRWADRGRTSEHFVCEIESPTRAENLARAWESVRELSLLTALTTVPPPSPAQTPRSSWAISETVRRQMQANKGRDTRPELALRSRVHALGLRYRVGVRPLPSIRRTADLVFTRARVAVFLDGCFWHGCPEHHRPAKTNEDFWHQKIMRNCERDQETTRLLQDAGWAVLRIWEHEEPESAALTIHQLVSDRHHQVGKSQAEGHAREPGPLLGGLPGPGSR